MNLDRAGYGANWAAVGSQPTELPPTGLTGIKARVADAMWRSRQFASWDAAVSEVIAAMREPTKAMVRVIDSMGDFYDEYQGKHLRVDELWREMIARALK